MSLRTIRGLALLGFLLLTLLGAPTAHTAMSAPANQEDPIGMMDGFVIDRLGSAESGMTTDFIAQFNERVFASQHPIFLLILREDDINSEYTDEAARRIINIPDFNSRLSAFLQSQNTDSFVMIVIAPTASEGTRNYERGATSLIYEGRYEVLSTTPSAEANEPILLAVSNKIDEMVAAGNWQEGALEGVSMLTRELTRIGMGPGGMAAPEPPVNSGSAGTVPVNPPAVPVPVQSPPAQPIQLPWWLGWLLGIPVFGALIAWLLAALNRHLKERARVRAARNAAFTQYNALLSKVTGFEPQARDTDQYVIGVLRNTVPQRLLLPYEGLLADLRRDLGSVNTDTVALQESYPADRWNGYTEEDFAQIERLCAPLHERIDALYTRLDTLTRNAQALTSAAQNVTSQSQQAALLFGQSAEHLARARERFTDTTIEGRITEGRALLVQVERLIVASTVTEEAYLEAAKLVQQAIQLATEALEIASNLEKRYTTLLAEATLYEGIFAEVRSLIEGATRAMTDLRGGFHQTLWRTVEGNIAKADQALEVAQGHLSAANRLSGVFPVQLGEMDRLLDLCNEAQEDAQFMCVSITDLLAELIDLRERAPGLMSSATRTATMAIKFLTAHDRDVPEALDTLFEAAHRELEDARTESGATLPDWRKIHALAISAQQKADQILKEARTGHENMVAAHRNAENELTLATRALADTDRYMDDNRHELRSSTIEQYAEAERQLTRARELMQQADVATDGQEQQRLTWYTEAATLAGTVRESAQSVLERAQSDVREANRPVYTGSGYSGSYRGYSGGSGGSGGDTTVIVTNTSTSWGTPSPSTRRSGSSVGSYGGGGGGFGGFGSSSSRSSGSSVTSTRSTTRSSAPSRPSTPSRPSSPAPRSVTSTRSTRRG